LEYELMIKRGYMFRSISSFGRVIAEGLGYISEKSHNTIDDAFGKESVG